jgi:hypothetical protein
MHELVSSTLHSRLLSALRLPSFAGEGLPERMRSISFALLGLTAAAGLALVAIFAQPGFNLLSPAPLPDQPSLAESVAEAKRLPLDRHVAPLVAAPPARQRHGAEPAAAGSPSARPVGSSGGSGGASAAPAEVDAPAPSAAAEASGGNHGGNGGKGGSGGSSPAPAAPEQAGSSPSPPASPQPSTATPQATASTPKPAPAPAPGSSSSSAAAEHASERGIEASASSAPSASGGATTSAVAPESPASPGNGNGLAKGHDK